MRALVRVARAGNHLSPAFERIAHHENGSRSVAANMVLADDLIQRRRWRAHGERNYSRAHRTHRRPRRKERTPRPARETSGREVRFLSMNGRGGAGRARWLPWQCATARVKRPILVKWKILDRD